MVLNLGLSLLLSMGMCCVCSVFCRFCWSFIVLFIFPAVEYKNENQPTKNFITTLIKISFPYRVVFSYKIGRSKLETLEIGINSNNKNTQISVYI